MASGTDQSPSTRLRARHFAVTYDETPSRIWVRDNPFLTHWLNAYTLTIPDGEDFIIRTLREFLDKIEDEELKQNALGLIGQEISHSRGHMAFFKVLEDQGFKLNTYLKFTRFVSFRILQPLSFAKQRLAFVVGIERMNEIISEVALESGKLQDAAPPVRALYEWHFAEEIEHKAVAFDVFQHVSGSRFWLTYGVVLCYFTFLSYLLLGCATFLRQDRRLLSWTTWKQGYRLFFREERLIPRLTRGCLQLLRRGFHPSQNQNGHLAEHVLSRRVITASDYAEANEAS